MVEKVGRVVVVVMVAAPAGRQCPSTPQAPALGRVRSGGVRPGAL